jgi:hypothetical protein
MIRVSKQERRNALKQRMTRYRVRAFISAPPSNNASKAQNYLLTLISVKSAPQFLFFVNGLRSSAKCSSSSPFRTAAINVSMMVGSLSFDRKDNGLSDDLRHVLPNDLPNAKQTTGEGRTLSGGGSRGRARNLNAALQEAPKLEAARSTSPLPL